MLCSRTGARHDPAQLVPSQCSANVTMPPAVAASPTAEQSEVVGHDTANSSAEEPAGFGLATLDHAAPFQCSVSVFVAPEVVVYEPTAKQPIRGCTRDLRGRLCEACATSGAIDHADPFQ